MGLPLTEKSPTKCEVPTTKLDRAENPPGQFYARWQTIREPMTSMLPYLFAAYPLCFVIAALVWLLRAKPQSWPHYSMMTAVCGSIIVFVFLAGPWAFTSYYLRYVSLGLFALAVIFMCQRIKINRQNGKNLSGASFAILALALLLFVVLDALAIAAYHQPGNPLNLSFPLALGRYYVLQGGNSAVTNPFHALSGSKLALDIVKLNAFGNRAGGIAPLTLNAYEIFGEKVYSPCAGSVSYVRDGLPDNAPGRPEVKYPEGNYVVLKCGDTEVFMAHLKRGSIALTVGEVVAVGQLIGNVGNSGNTLEPHLHISATMSGAERGLQFRGRKLSVNSVVAR